MTETNSIDIFPWNENFNTGVPEIDAQHKKLVQLLNLLASHLAFQSDLPELNVIFDELSDYAAYHFQTEEAIWHRYLPEDLLESHHKQTHDSFIQTVRTLKQGQIAKSSDEVLEEMLAFLTRWLAAHILESDKHLARVVLAIQSGMPLETAKTHASVTMSGTTRVLIDIILSIYETLSTNTLHLMRELSQRKPDEESLRKLSLAVEQSPSSIVITDLDANIEFVNDAFLKATGYSRAEAIGQNPRILQSGKTSATTYREMWTSLAQGKIWKGEFVNKRKDGSEYIELALISPVQQPDGKVTHYLAIKEDITERTNLERHLFDQLTLNQSIIEAEVNGIAVLHSIDESPYTHFTVWNPSMQALTGFSLAEINRLGWCQTVYADPETQERAKLRMQRMHRGDHLHGEEWTITRKNGEQRIVQISTTPCAHSNLHVLLVIHDVTDRKQAEDAAFQAAQYARSLIEASLDPLVTISADGKITDVNTATEQVTGIARRHLIGSDFATYFTDPEKARAGYQQVFTQGLVTDYPLAIRHPSGKLTDVLYNATVYRDIAGQILGVFAAARDITERKRIEAKLIASESRLRAIIENEPECIKIVDAEGILLQMNPAGLAMLEADTIDQLIGLPVINLIAPEYHRAFAELHAQVLAGKAQTLEYEVIGLKGGRRWVETHAVPMKDANGKVLHLAVSRDIHERKQAEYQLRIAATVFESQECMMVTSADNTILRVNKAFTEITGYTTEDVFGKNPRLLHSTHQSAEFYTSMWNSISNTGRWEGEIWNMRKNGEIFPAYLTVTSVKDQNDKVTHYVGTLTDITLRKAAADEIERLAFYDPLTGLPNRRLLQDRLKLALASSDRSGRIGALLFIDLDNFKALNDTLGHDMGDLLLQQVAERLTSCIREGDTVARLGGDEFVVMLQDLSEHPLEAAKQAETVGKKIISLINKPFKLAQHDHISTPSIGAALFSGHKYSADELLKHADIAMYQAKTSGRNALRFFDPKMQEAIHARVSLEDDLRKALGKLQFQLYYQIQVKGSQDLLGAEALIRWIHPERGMISPAEFIPLAEETGLIIPIGHWVLETACAQLKAWQYEAFTRNLALSVNVSAKQFFQADFIARVQSTIQYYGVNPSLLKLELTESLLIENIEETIAIMNALGAIGVQFSLDDFGTGYSSLQYLKKLPLSQLKIAQPFIRDLADSGDQTIVRTIIAMAVSLNLNVIAEGVETEEQRQFLWENGCSDYQGYLFSKPVPIEQLSTQLRSMHVH